MKHPEVLEALDLVVSEVDNESQRIRDAGGEALKAGKLKPAKKAIEYAEKLAALGLMVGGEPLVTKDRKLFVKQPKAVAEIAGGWFVKTHSSTASKIDAVRRIAKALGAKIVVKEA